MRLICELNKIDKRSIGKHIYVIEKWIGYDSSVFSNFAFIESSKVSAADVLNLPASIVTLIIKIIDPRLISVLPFVPYTVKDLVFEGSNPIPERLLSAVPHHLTIFENQKKIRDPLPLSIPPSEEMDVVIEPHKNKKRKFEEGVMPEEKRMCITRTPFNLFQKPAQNNIELSPQFEKLKTMELC